MFHWHYCRQGLRNTGYNLKMESTRECCCTWKKSEMVKSWHKTDWVDIAGRGKQSQYSKQTLEKISEKDLSQETSLLYVSHIKINNKGKACWKKFVAGSLGKIQTSSAWHARSKSVKKTMTSVPGTCWNILIRKNKSTTLSYGLEITALRDRHFIFFGRCCYIQESHRSPCHRTGRESRNNGGMCYIQESHRSWCHRAGRESRSRNNGGMCYIQESDRSWCHRAGRESRSRGGRSVAVWIERFIGKGERQETDGVHFLEALGGEGVERGSV